MHPIEQAWQKFRKDDHLCMEAVDSLLEAGRASEHFGITCQSSRLGAYILAAAHKAYGPSRPDDLLNAVNALAFQGNAWAAYRENKAIYRFTPELTRELGKFKDPLGWPLRTLRLPHRGIALDFSAALGPNHPDAYILLTYDDSIGDALTQNAHQTLLTINVMRVNNQRKHTRVCNLPANPSTEQQTLWEAMAEEHRAGIYHLEQVLAEIHERFGDTPMSQRLNRTWGLEIQHHQKEIAGGPEGLIAQCPILPAVISALYYLQGDPDVVKSIHPGMRPPKRDRKINWAKTLHKQTLVAPNVQLIGESFSAAIKHYEIEQERLKSVSQGGTKCPHLRRPHLHTYWRGPERDQLSIKFLGWIGVAGAEVPESLKEAYAPVITPVE